MPSEPKLIIAAPSQQLQIMGGAHAAELRKVLLDTYY